MNNNTSSTRRVTDEADDPRLLKGFPAQIYEWLEAIAFALAIVVILFTFVVRIVSVSGVSMMDTLHDGDRVLVFSIGYTPEQNDIVIVLPEKNNDELNGDLNKPLVKRVIATEGQWIDFRDGQVYVADTEEGLLSVEKFDCVSLKANDATTYTPYENAYPMQIDDGCVYVMGDNRAHSTDSREIGPVKAENILGKVIFRIFPFNDSFGSVE